MAKGSTIKKQDKVEQILHRLKVANIGKMWYKQTAAKSGINFTLSFSGNYWHKSLLKIEGQDTVWQKAVKCSTSKWQGIVQVQAFIIGLSLLRARD